MFVTLARPVRAEFLATPFGLRARCVELAQSWPPGRTQPMASAQPLMGGGGAASWGRRTGSGGGRGHGGTIWGEHRHWPLSRGRYRGVALERFGDRSEVCTKNRRSGLGVHRRWVRLRAVAPYKDSSIEGTASPRTGFACVCGAFQARCLVEAGASWRSGRAVRARPERLARRGGPPCAALRWCGLSLPGVAPSRPARPLAQGPGGTTLARGWAVLAPSEVAPWALRQSRCRGQAPVSASGGGDVGTARCWGHTVHRHHALWVGPGGRNSSMGAQGTEFDDDPLLRPSSRLEIRRNRRGFGRTRSHDPRSSPHNDSSICTAGTHDVLQTLRCKSGNVGHCRSTPMHEV